MNNKEEFLDDKVVVTCPICGSTPTIDQPEPGTHCYGTVYECGARVVTAIGYRDSNRLEKSCSDESSHINKSYLIDRLNSALRKESYGTYSYEVLKESLNYVDKQPT